MALGLYGWAHTNVDIVRDPQVCDMVFTGPKRDIEHVAAVVRGPKSGLLEIAHATVHKGVITEPMPKWIEKEFKKAGRLNQLG